MAGMRLIGAILLAAAAVVAAEDSTFNRKMLSGGGQFGIAITKDKTPAPAPAPAAVAINTAGKGSLIKVTTTTTTPVKGVPDGAEVTKKPAPVHAGKGPFEWSAGGTILKYKTKSKVVQTGERHGGEILIDNQGGPIVKWTPHSKNWKPVEKVSDSGPILIQGGGNIVNWTPHSSVHKAQKVTDVTVSPDVTGKSVSVSTGKGSVNVGVFPAGSVKATPVPPPGKGGDDGGDDGGDGDGGDGDK